MKKKKLSPPLLIVTHRQVTPPPFSYSVALLLIDWLNLFMQVGFPLFSLRLQHSLYSEWNQFGTEWFEEEEWKSNVISCLRIAAAAHKKKKTKVAGSPVSSIPTQMRVHLFFFLSFSYFYKMLWGKWAEKVLMQMRQPFLPSFLQDRCGRYTSLSVRAHWLRRKRDKNGTMSTLLSGHSR